MGYEREPLPRHGPVSGAALAGHPLPAGIYICDARQERLPAPLRARAEERVFVETPPARSGRSTPACGLSSTALGRRRPAPRPLDLQELLARCCRDGRYEGTLDYQRAPDPPLEPEDAAWADELLRGAGLR